MDPVKSVRDLTANDEINAHHWRYPRIHPKVVYLPSSTCTYMKATAGIPGRKTTTAQSTPTWQAGIVAKAIRRSIAPRSKKMPNKGDSNGPADGETPESAVHYKPHWPESLPKSPGQRSRYAERNPGNGPARSRQDDKAVIFARLAHRKGATFAGICDEVLPAGMGARISRK